MEWLIIGAAIIAAAIVVILLVMRMRERRMPPAEDPGAAREAHLRAENEFRGRDSGGDMGGAGLG